VTGASPKGLISIKIVIFTDFGNVNWPSRSPDLSVCGPLGGYFKSCACVTNSNALEQLKNNIRDEILSVQPHTL
jgi:hypothetical protein